MATYQVGVTDVIPTAAPFDPNLDFYAGVLAIKQNQYDQNLGKLNSIYSSAFNQPMTGEDNIARRDTYFKSIKDNLKKVAAMDLSIDQNQASAKTIFDPILNDKDMINDIVFTKSAMDSYQRGEQFRNCPDPDKCGGEAWEEGFAAIKYAVDDFKKASPQERLKMQAPSYVPKQNVMRKAMLAAKNAGIDVSVEDIIRGYNVTSKNGEPLYKSGVLHQFLQGVIGSDPKVQDMYTVQAMVKRRGMAQEIAAKTGKTEEEAEGLYLNEVITRSNLKIAREKEALLKMQNDISVKMKAYGAIADEKGGTTQGDGIHDNWSILQSVTEKLQGAGAYHDALDKILTTAPNVNDRLSMRHRVDQIVANADLIDDLNSAAYTYAMGTAKTDIKANEFALASHQAALNFDNQSKLKKIDQDYWFQQQAALGNIDYDGTGQSKGVGLKNQIREALLRKFNGNETAMWQKLNDMEIRSDNLFKKENIDKMTAAQLFDKDPDKVATPFYTVDKYHLPKVDTFVDNSRVTADSAMLAKDSSKAFVNTTVANMQQEWKVAAGYPDVKKGQILKDKILSDLGTALEGTGLSVDKVLDGTTPLNLLNDSALTKIANGFANTRLKDPSSKLYNNNWSDDDIVELQVYNQSAGGLIEKRFEFQKAAVADMHSNLAANIDLGYSYLHQPSDPILPEDVIKNKILLQTAYDENGNPVKKDKAYPVFHKHMFDMFVKEAERARAVATPGSPGADPNRVIPNAEKNIKGFFDKTYDNYNTEYNKNLNSLTSKLGSYEKAGGSSLTSSAVPFNFKGDDVLSGDVIQTENVFKELNRTGNFNATGFTSDGSGDESETKKQIASKLVNKIAIGDYKGLEMSGAMQYVPTDKENKVFMKVTVTDEKTVRDLNDLKPSDAISQANNTFMIEAPANLESLKPFMQKLVTPPPDILLAHEGGRISVDLPGKGKITVRNYKGNLFYEPAVLWFDDRLGKWEYRVDIGKLIDMKNDPVRAMTVFKDQKEGLDLVYAAQKDKERKYILKSIQSGQATE